MLQVIVSSVDKNDTITICAIDIEVCPVCVGIPMEIIEQREFTALCRGRDGEKVVETLLIGPQPEGTWVLTFLGSAREILSPEEAGRITDALALVEALIRGREGGVDLDAPFADLLDPSRPPGGFHVKRSGG